MFPKVVMHEKTLPTFGVVETLPSPNANADGSTAADRTAPVCAAPADVATVLAPPSSAAQHATAGQRRDIGPRSIAPPSVGRR